MSLNYTIVVNDSGELKTVTAKELDDLALKHAYLCEALDRAINSVLDNRSFAEETSRKLEELGFGS